MKRVLVAVVALLILTGCSSISTDNATIGLHYKGGAFTSTKFANCVGSGTRNWDGPGDKHYVYPGGQRTYKFTKEGNSDHGPYAAFTNDSVHMDYSGIVTFYLDSKCANLRRFHESIGLKNWAGHPAYIEGGDYSGWNAMLDAELGQAIQRALNQVSGDYDYKSLLNDNATRDKAENELQDLLPGYVKRIAGRDYFTRISVTLQKPEAPATIVAALNDNAAQIQAQVNQEKANDTARTQYDTFDDCKRHLSEANCVLLYLGQHGKAGIVLAPAGSGVNVGTP